MNDEILTGALAMTKPGMEFVIKTKHQPDKVIEIRAVVDGEWYVYRWYSEKLGPQYRVMELMEMVEMWHSGRLIPHDPEQWHERTTEEE